MSITVENARKINIILLTKNNYILLDEDNNLPSCEYNGELVSSLNNYFNNIFGYDYTVLNDNLKIFEVGNSEIFVINKNFNYKKINFNNIKKQFYWNKLNFKDHINNFSCNCHCYNCCNNCYSNKSEINSINDILLNKYPNFNNYINNKLDIEIYSKINNKKDHFRLEDSYINKSIDVVVGLLIDNNNNVLIQQRKNSLWEFPGGKVEPYESTNEAIIRELQEELNIKIKNANINSIKICNNTSLNTLINYNFYLMLIGNLYIDSSKINVNEAIQYKIVNINELDSYEFMQTDKNNIISYIKNNLNNIPRINFNNFSFENNTNNLNKKGNEIMNNENVINNVNNVMQNETNNLFNGNLFSKLSAGVCKFTITGKIAVKTTTGYKTYDVKSGKLTNCNNFCMPFGDNMFFIVPATKVKTGDIILLNNEPTCVIKYENNQCTVMNFNTDKIETIIPERNFMFGNMYFFHKIVSIFGKFFGGNMSVFGGNIMKYMMINQMFNNTNNTNNQTNNMFQGFDMNTLMMMQMMKNNKNNDLDESENVFDNLFNFDESDDENTENNKAKSKAE